VKTALDLPDELAREIKIRAAQQDRKLKDVIAELLRRGLEAEDNPVLKDSSPLVRDDVTGLLTVACRHPARYSEQLTTARVAAILLDQEVAWNNEASR